jgi:hypothetical protein
MENSSTPNPKPEDILTWKMNNSDEYQKRILNDYEFAQQELGNAGIKIDQQSHEKFSKAFSNLIEASEIFGGLGKRINFFAIFIDPLGPLGGAKK